ncbi:hypothetical protein [Laspinema olomoucense]|uniref:Uncharacterized protein n=1 Tax=Laspinema olomoucense D3b TaxID=2953688 RepID=A0ABT2N827_9CYAN|nr:MULTISPECIES: hypothetical protein [unclassified Laspinema]MCT7972420.1 hypothetical protein [Laspinema sp. D3d]MCT7977895.1 hypothetical protein [Laspinema sp. D3b]MCT7994331.1 hypothetical protein [Laspinema sp. D3c]
MKREKELAKLREITENTIEDVVGKMWELGKSFPDIAQYLILSEAEVEEAFIRYRHRFERGDRTWGKCRQLDLDPQKYRGNIEPGTATLEEFVQTEHEGRI